jgi:hypothetical protein
MPQLILNIALSLATTIATAQYAMALKWSDYDHLDPHHQIPTQALKQAVTYYDEIKQKISNPNFLTVIDYSQHSNQRRFYLINMESGFVESLKVAHGQGSDADHDGVAEKFSNRPNSKASSLGFYLTGATYSGQHGTSLYLDGLSLTNNNARSRAIVIHGADYVSDKKTKIGRSWGCPALDKKKTSQIINRIKNGSLIYAWAGQATKKGG